MAIDNTASGLKSQIEREIQIYTTGVVQIGESEHSQYKLVRRISLFESHTYTAGKFDKQGNYKYWFDISSPRIDQEVKNIDFIVTKDTRVYSYGRYDDIPNLVMNLELHKCAREHGLEEETNDAVEEISGWGNRVWKKVGGYYEGVDLKNFYVINQTARTLAQSAVIERHEMQHSDLREMQGKWDDANIKATLEGLKEESYKKEIQVTPTETTVPYYEIFERNGEVCLADLKKARGEAVSDNDHEKYVHAKVVAAGTKSSGAGVTIMFILFAQQMSGDNSDIYKEVHRGRYEGRWFRKGIYEILFDLQVRANMIGNQIAQGLEYAGKIVFHTPDKLILANILSDLKNGDVIRASSLSQLEVRMNGLDQLIADWNRVLALANDLTNSNAIIQGHIQGQVSEKLGMTMNQNANKLYDFIRQKISIVYSEMYEKWLVPKLAKSITAQEILSLTGDSMMLDRLYQVIVEAWYIENLVAIGPHTADQAESLKQMQLENLKARPQLLMQGLETLFKNYLPRVIVDVGGSRDNSNQEVQDLMGFINLEQDPVRRTGMIEMAMRKKGIDIGGLPKAPPPTTSTAILGGGNAPAEKPAIPQKSNPQPTARRAPAYSA